MKDRADAICTQTLQELKQVRLDILREVRENPKILVQNLYKQQGELRFDASNRLFGVLYGYTKF